jgi:hypothetical protein
MAHDLLLAPEAETDVAEAYEWYEVRRRGLVEEFLSCVDAALSGILRDPDLHAIAFSNCPRIVVVCWYVAFPTPYFTKWPMDW